MKAKNFWEKHYANFGEQAPSPFCIYCMDKILSPQDVLIELGCGNGRDGIELVQVVNKYIGLDSCSIAINKFEKTLNENKRHKLTPELIKSDFTKFDFNEIEGKRIAIYSRFSLHSIDYLAQQRFIENLLNVNNANWICMLEVRTIYDELYGEGKMVGKHEFETDHYRRFIDPQSFLSEMSNLFSIRYFEISRGFAMYKGSDPIVLRTVFGPKS